MDYLTDPVRIEPTTGQTNPPSRVRIVLRVAAGIAGCAALAGLSFAVDAAVREQVDTIDLTGVVTVNGIAPAPLSASACAGERSVTVSGDSGTPLAAGSVRSDEAGPCVFEFTIADVPRRQRFYEVTIGRDSPAGTADAVIAISLDD